MRRSTDWLPALRSRDSAIAKSSSVLRRSPAIAAGIRTRSRAGIVARTGLKGSASQPRNPQITRMRSGPPPPSSTTNGSRPIDMSRNQSSDCSSAKPVRSPGSLVNA
jgi:hypothetical protein